MERRFNREALKAIDGIAALDPSKKFEAFSEEKVLTTDLCFKLSFRYPRLTEVFKL